MFRAFLLAAGLVLASARSALPMRRAAVRAPPAPRPPPSSEAPRASSSRQSRRNRQIVSAAAVARPAHRAAIAGRSTASASSSSRRRTRSTGRRAGERHRLMPTARDFELVPRPRMRPAGSPAKPSNPEDCARRLRA